jgi:CheY-like chemotaxis protein
VRRGKDASKTRRHDQGSTFIVELPVVATHLKEDDRPAGLPPAVAEPYAEEFDLGGVRVLVVDDEPDSLSLVRRTLKDRGAAVETAVSVDEAMNVVTCDAPAVVVCDISMPGKDGYDLIRALRALPADKGGRTPAIALTALVRPDDRIRALLAGYQVHLGKPVEPWELVATLANLVGRTPQSPHHEPPRLYFP